MLIHVHVCISRDINALLLHQVMMMYVFKMCAAKCDVQVES